MKNGDKPAFSVCKFSLPTDQILQANVVGLTKREYFVGLAMQGLLANHYMGIKPIIETAELAIMQADELLK